MISLNTNMPSLIAQRSLNNSTKLLNQAIERMTTGFKINHASDNAANYSISTNMSTKISSYQVAEDNVAMGLDLLSTAGGSLDLISDKLTRLRALAEQSANGTYGEQSLKAINSEANAIVDEIERIYSTAEYNGIKLFGETKSQFIEEVQQITESDAVAQGYTIIRTAEDLHKMDKSSDKFILMNDIDLSGYSTGEGWEPIENFDGIFDGNGYVISNLYMNRPHESYQGLFDISSGNINNLGLEDVNITGFGKVAAFVTSFSGSITNCYATGVISAQEYTGGLVGVSFEGSITNSYTDMVVSVVHDACGGLVGISDHDEITNCYSIGSVSGTTDIGGLLGYCSSIQMTDCYAIGAVMGTGQIGGLIGNTDGGAVSITDSYYNTETTGQSDTGKGNGVTTAELQSLIANGTLPFVKQDMNQQIISFQVGIDSNKSSQITLDTAFNLKVSSLRGIGLGGNNLSQIDSLINSISAIQTDFGAAENRLESALEEISTQYDNLISSRSTLRDADIAEVSSEYIRQQILQQASATLMATANQTPALALQLL